MFPALPGFSGGWTGRRPFEELALVIDTSYSPSGEQVRAFGRRLVEETDAALVDAEAGDIRAALMAANETMAGRLRYLTHKLLDNVLYTSSNLMRNSFAMSDRWV